MSVQVEKRQFNVSEYYLMAEAGILSEDDRVELIEGEIVKMTPIGRRHAACVDRLNRLLNRLVGDEAIVRVQNPIRIDEYAEPQPDIALLKLRQDFYSESHPSPSDVLLVIEVAESSLQYDRQVKVPLYARARIPEVWVVNLEDDFIEIYKEPADESYKKITIVKHGESIEFGSIPLAKINSNEILA